jgi:hypothetical protein
MRLNLGCSTDLRGKGWLNVDMAPLENITTPPPAEGPMFAFQQADLTLPWPWEDSSVEEIYAADIFEHIGDCPHLLLRGSVCQICNLFLRADKPTVLRACGVIPKLRHWSGRIHVMNESWRVLKPGGILTMECPDAAKGAGQWQDPTHTTPWTPNGLQYFADGSPAHKRFAAAYGITARFKVLSVSERKYEENAGPPFELGAMNYVRCEVYKFTAILEAVK